MNRTTARIALAPIFAVTLALNGLLVACGNKGDLFLETDQVISDEINQLGESLEELDEESDKKPSKKTDPNS